MFGYSAFSETPFATQPSNAVSVLVELEGVSSTGQVGSVLVTADANLLLDGVFATGVVGSVTVNEGTGVDVFVTGVSATGELTPVLVWGRIVPNPGTVYTEIQPSDSTIWTEIAA